MARALPDFLIKSQLSLTAKIVGKSDTKYKEIYAQMVSEMATGLVRWQSGAATEWELTQKLSMPVFHVHGDKDKIVPIANIKSPAVVKDGGHLINITHSNQVNGFIKECLNQSEKPNLKRAV